MCPTPTRNLGSPSLVQGLEFVTFWIWGFGAEHLKLSPSCSAEAHFNASLLDTFHDLDFLFDLPNSSSLPPL